MTTPEQVVQKSLVFRYGDLVRADAPHFDENTGTWYAELRSTYPRIIRSEKDSDDVVVRFLDLHDLGWIRLDRNLQVVEATPRPMVQASVVSRIDLWKQQAERIVLRATPDVFARIAEGTHVLNPLRLVIDMLTKEKAGEVKITDALIEQHDKPETIRKYLELLTGLKVVKKVNGAYTYDNMFTMMAEKANYDRRILRMAMISYVISERYPTLRQVFGITQLEPFLRLDNCYYWGALDAERLMYSTKSRLHERYKSYYGAISVWRFQSILRDLEEQETLVEDGSYVLGNQKHLEGMLGLKRTTQQLNPPIS